MIEGSRTCNSPDKCQKCCCLNAKNFENVVHEFYKYRLSFTHSRTGNNPDKCQKCFYLNVKNFKNVIH